MAKLVSIYNNNNTNNNNSTTTNTTSTNKNAIACQLSSSSSSSSSQSTTSTTTTQQQQQQQQQLLERQIPITIDDQLTMIMQIDDLPCIGCEKEMIKKRDYDQYLRRYPKLFINNKNYLYKHLFIKPNDLINSLQQLIPCIGCKTSVERFYKQLLTNNKTSTTTTPTIDSGTNNSNNDILSIALAPLIIDSQGYLTIKRSLIEPKSLYHLFYVHGTKLDSLIESIPKNKKNRRCFIHSLDTHKTKNLDDWIEVWQSMSNECCNQLLIINKNNLMQTLDNYLRKHRFCSDCKNKVMCAFNILIGESDSSKEKGYNATLFDGIKYCSKHIHLTCDRLFVSQLIQRAESEIQGNRRERHAKTIEVAQEEVLTCIGIYLYEKFHRIRHSMRSEEQTWQLLFYIGVYTLKKCFEFEIEKVNGNNDIEFDDDCNKENRKLNKKQKKNKTNNTNNNNNSMIATNSNTSQNKKSNLNNSNNNSNNSKLSNTSSSSSIIDNHIHNNTNNNNKNNKNWNDDEDNDEHEDDDVDVDDDVDIVSDEDVDDDDDEDEDDDEVDEDDDDDDHDECSDVENTCNCETTINTVNGKSNTNNCINSNSKSHINGKTSSAVPINCDNKITAAHVNGNGCVTSKNSCNGTSSSSSSSSSSNTKINVCNSSSSSSRSSNEMLDICLNGYNNNRSKSLTDNNNNNKNINNKNNNTTTTNNINNNNNNKSNNNNSTSTNNRNLNDISKIDAGYSSGHESNASSELCFNTEHLICNIEQCKCHQDTMDIVGCNELIITQPQICGCDTINGNYNGTTSTSTSNSTNNHSNNNNNKSNNNCLNANFNCSFDIIGYSRLIEQSTQNEDIIMDKTNKITEEEKNEYYANKTLYLNERTAHRMQLKEKFQNIQFKIKPRNT